MSERRRDGERETPELTAAERAKLEAWEAEEPSPDFVERVARATYAAGAEGAGLREVPAKRRFDLAWMSGPGGRARRAGALLAVAAGLCVAAAVAAWVLASGNEPAVESGAGVTPAAPRTGADGVVVAATAAAAPAGEARVEEELGVGGGGRVGTGEVIAVAPGTAAGAGAGTASPAKPDEKCPGGICPPRFGTGMEPVTAEEKCAHERLAAAEKARAKLEAAGFHSRGGSPAIAAEGRRFEVEMKRIRKLYTEVAGCGFGEGTVKAAFRRARAEERFVATILEGTPVDPAYDCGGRPTCKYGDTDRVTIERLAAHVSKDVERAYVRVIELGRELHVENAWTRGAAEAGVRLRAASRALGASGPDPVPAKAGPPAPAPLEGGDVPEDIGRVARTGVRAVKLCYDAALPADRYLEGVLRVRFSVNAAGKVTFAAIMDSSLGSPPVEECVLGVVRSWVFPARPGAEETYVILPFSFSTGGAPE